MSDEARDVRTDGGGLMGITIDEARVRIEAACQAVAGKVEIRPGAWGDVTDDGVPCYCPLGALAFAEQLPLCGAIVSRMAGHLGVSLGAILGFTAGFDGEIVSAGIESPAWFALGREFRAKYYDTDGGDQ